MISTRPPPGAEIAAGSFDREPPSEFQALNEPLKIMRQIELSKPTAYAVNWLPAPEEAVKPPPNPPPWPSQTGDQDPVNDLCHLPLSVPRTNPSMPLRP